ncbi:hypothetical protein [Bartonella sp. HY406]|uniref:hypothetical protein n=1 Tax=Bartonella sp. HY406 TaxID=2979331 RepID=UPI0021C8A7C7|nr:hypothetical protein [Bartonella sp. HY406]UXN04583.1 hypothetical protein N6B01_06120 [Bartonella sp. HY406]
MKLPVLLAIGSAFIMLSGCSSNSSSALLTNNEANETTGYWYLGDNGQRQWRTFTNEPNSQDNAVKNTTTGIRPFGNGSGR